MCNLYRLDPSQKVFDFTAEEIQQFNVPLDIYPNYPGIVIESGQPKAMNWGFPARLKHMKPTSKPKPVNNTRDDKLRTFFWRDSFERRRCLIPVSQWAEAWGKPGAMTKTWYSLPDTDAFAVAGIWRHSDEWGLCYSMVMTDANMQMAEAHDRMPVILAPDDYQQWTHGTPDEAFALVQTWQAPLVVDATDELWSVKR